MCFYQRVKVSLTLLCLQKTHRLLFMMGYSLSPGRLRERP